MILQGYNHYHGEFIGVEEIGLFKALVISDNETKQHRYINISKENSIDEIIFESEEEKDRFIEICTPNSINISK